MRKRSSRVYFLLIFMSFVMFISFILDMTVTKTSDIIDENTIISSSEDSNLSVNADKSSKNSQSDNDTLVSTEETDTTTETTTLSQSEMTKVEKFYSNSVFVGDSIMSGFAQFASSDKRAPEFVSNLTFLSAASYGVNAAITGKHLIYKGQSNTLFDNLSTINPDKIFINLGINELNGVKAEKIGEKYGEMINKIHEVLPDAKIYTMGLTYFVKGKETSTYNNEGLKAYNKYLKEHSSEWKTTYIELGERLTDKDGYLPLKYASDGRIHQNNDAYMIWVEFLQDIALNRI